MSSTASQNGDPSGGSDRRRDPILVVGPAWVGDMVMADSLFLALKVRWPDRPIDVLAPAATLPVLDFLPAVRRGIAQPLGHGSFGLGERRRLGRSLRGAGYGTAYVLPRSWKSALAPFFARVPERIGYWGEARLGLINRPRRLDKRRLGRTVERFAALASPPGATPTVMPPHLDVPAAATATALAGLLPDTAPADRLLVLCPGAEYGPAKRWPAAHAGRFAALAAAAGWTVCLIGGPKDRQIAQAIAELAPAAIDLTGRTTLAQAIALIARADQVVSNDSGLMHVAAALGRPQVALFGSSSPAHTPPLNPAARTIALGLDCQPCFARDCPLGHLNCLVGITPERVMAELPP
ncbi:MAG: lipopolysaccharide heptosyltransferase II [Azospirillaceae bacterium]